MMGAAARLHADQTRLELGAESQQLCPAQAPAQDDLAGPIESDKVKYGLRHIDAYRRYCHEWSSFRLKPATPASPSPKGRTIPLAQTEGRTIVFIDESGLTQKPHRCRTWAPRGETPVLQYSFNWKMLSAAAGLTFHDLYFRFYDGAIASRQVVEFLQALERQIDRPLLLIWDRLAAHRSWLVQEFIRASGGRIEQIWLPAYAPELNPVEYVWAYWKQHELPNVCPKDYADLSQTARRTLRRVRRRKRLIPSFWKQAKLSFE
jgi:transposase